MTINDILTEIITEVGGDIADTDFRAKMLVFITGALRKVPRKLRDRSLITTSTMALTLNSDNVALPSNFVEELNVWYLDEAGRRVIIEQPVTRTDFHLLRTTGQAKPSLYIITGKNIYFNCPADAAITVYIEHFATIYNVSLSDVFGGSDSLIEPVKELCKGIYYSDYEEDQAKGDRKLMQAASDLADLESDYMQQETGGHIGD